MGIFGDIGRSNATRDAQSVFGDVMKYHQMERQEDKDAMTGIAQLQAMEVQKKQLALQQAQEQRAQTEFQQKQKEAARRLPLTLRWGPMDSWSNSKKAIVEEGRKMGLVEDVGGIPTASPNDYKVFQESIDPAKALEISAVNLSEHAEDMGNIQKKLAANPDDEKLIAERDRIVGLYTSQKEKTTALTDALAAKKKAEGEGKDLLAERRLDEAERSNRAREDAMDRRLGLMERIAAGKAEGKQLGFADKEALRAMGKQLPKSKIAADTASKNVQKIDRMLGLIDKGAGGVRGELLAKINKAADLLRVTPPEDAKYNQLKAELRGFAGTLRLQLGLIGQTSDRDVAIMYEAAGGMSPAESQKAILSGYRQGYMQDVTNYNSDAEAYGEYSPAGRNLFRKVNVPGIGAAGPSVVPGGVPGKSAWLAEAQKANPKSSQKELSDYYDQKYGGKK